MSMTKVGGKRLIVLGGGLSGLCYLHYLRNFTVALNKRGLIDKVTLIEANDYMGGSVKTRLYEDGPVHELGPRSIRTAGAKAKNTAVLLEELGLVDKILCITRKSSAGRNRFVYIDNKLHMIPTSFDKMFAKLPNSRTTMLGALIRDFRAKPLDLNQFPHQDPSIYEFVSHRFGPDAAENIVDPIMRGITAGDARKLSTKALISDLLMKEQAYGSVLIGMFKPPVTKMPHDELYPNEVIKSKLLDKFDKDQVVSYGLSTGLQTIPEHLSNSLLNTNDDGLIDIFNRTKIEKIEFNNDPEGAPCSVEVSTLDGDRVRIDADHIVSAIPAKNLAKILPETMPTEQREALDYITTIPHSPVACVMVEYRNLKRSQLPKVLNSFGFLTHSRAGSRVLGISFDSTMFPQLDEPFDSLRMTCMIGGSWAKEVLGTDDMDRVTDAQLEQISLEEIRKILKLDHEPHRMSSLMWKTGIAQYAPGHKELLEECRNKIKKLSLPLTLTGQSYDGVAVNDVTFGARMAAYDFVKSL